MSEILQKCAFGVRHRLAIPSEISPEGHVQIRDLVISHLEGRLEGRFGGVSLQRVDGAFEEIGTEWKAKNGNYTKRLAKAFYKMGWELWPEIVQEAGNIARRNSAEEGTEYIFDFTNDFNWEAGDFGDDNSCFWGGRSIARKMIRGMGGIAIRFWSRDDENKGIGRAWVLPTEVTYHDYSKEPDTGVNSLVSNVAPVAAVFNSYGLDILVTARVLSTFLGMSYKRIRMINEGSADDVLYINGSGNAYAVAMPSTLTRISEIELHAHPDDYLPHCDECGSATRTTRVFEGRELCGRCMDRLVGSCTHCGRQHWIEDMERDNDSGYRFCETCWNDDSNFYQCDHCQNRTYGNTRYTVIVDNDGRRESWCYGCAAGANLRRCEHCNDYVLRDLAVQQQGRFTGYHNVLCPVCAETHHTCDMCGGIWSELEQITIRSGGREPTEANVCSRCAQRERELVLREQTYAERRAQEQREREQRRQMSMSDAFRELSETIDRIQAERAPITATVAAPRMDQGVVYVTVTLTEDGGFTVEERRDE